VVRVHHRPLAEARFLSGLFAFSPTTSVATPDPGPASVPNSAQSGGPDAFDVPLREQKLLALILERREDFDRAALEFAAAVESRINAHLDAADIALDALRDVQRQIADHTDLELDGDSRQSAMWLLIGRLVGMGKASVLLLRHGYCAEALPSLRVMHESSRMLMAFADRDEPDLLDRWLKDDDRKYLRPWEARGAEERAAERHTASLPDLKASAEEQGLDDMVREFERMIREAKEQPPAQLLRDGSRLIYDTLSRVAHGRRSGMKDSLMPDLRRMAMGPHPDPGMHVWYVSFGGLVVEEALIAVGGALTQGFWPGYLHGWTQPLVTALADVRAKHPLEDLRFTAP
jgi:hypothetical protein